MSISKGQKVAIVGRRPEKQELERYYHSSSPELLVVYGRRRVGAAFLVKQFFENRLQGIHTKDEYFWTNYIEDGAHRAWCGYAFESVCRAHIKQIKERLASQGCLPPQCLGAARSHSQPHRSAC